MGRSRNIENLSFEIKLLFRISDMKENPFTKLVIEKQLTEEEYNEIFKLLEFLNNKLEVQSEEGLLNFESLLVLFVGILNEKLNPIETLNALKKEGYYPSLIGTLLKTHENIKD